MEFLAALAGANLIFWILFPLILTIVACITATRWVDQRFGRGWAVGLGMTIIPLTSYFVMFNLTHLVSRGLIWLGLG